MLVHIPNLLNNEQLGHFCDQLDAANAPWVDGRVTAGHQGIHVKQNQQLAEGSAMAIELGNIVLAALERHPLFISAALPNRVYPPMFNRYQGGMHFGSHVDGSIRLLPGTGQKIQEASALGIPQLRSAGPLEERGKGSGVGHNLGFETGKNVIFSLNVVGLLG